MQYKLHGKSKLCHPVIWLNTATQCSNNHSRHPRACVIYSSKWNWTLGYPKASVNSSESSVVSLWPSGLLRDRSLPGQRREGLDLSHLLHDIVPLCRNDSCSYVSLTLSLFKCCMAFAFEVKILKVIPLNLCERADLLIWGQKVWPDLGFHSVAEVQDLPPPPTFARPDQCFSLPSALFDPRLPSQSGSAIAPQWKDRCDTSGQWAPGPQ